MYNGAIFRQCSVSVGTAVRSWCAYHNLSVVANEHVAAWVEVCRHVPSTKDGVCGMSVRGQEGWQRCSADRLAVTHPLAQQGCCLNPCSRRQAYTNTHGLVPVPYGALTGMACCAAKQLSVVFRIVC